MGMTPDEFLEHHGVKGMKWGIRKEEETSDQKSLTPHEKKVLSAAEKQGLNESRMKKMYGPQPKKASRKFKLNESQKSVLKKGLIVGGSVAAAYGLYKFGQNAVVKQQLGQFSDSEKLSDFWKKYQKEARQTQMSAKDVASLSTEAVHLPIGSILKRISTENETQINPKGFYAAFKDEDVNRYKAVLPVFWKLWGMDPSRGGHVVNLRAKQAIKAPSPKQAFDHFLEFLDTPHPNDPNTLWRDLIDPRHALKEIGLKPAGHIDTPTLGRKVYRQAAQSWNNPDDPMTEGFFKHIMSKGFNALIDTNDASRLSDTPLRVLNGAHFENAGNTRLSVDDIRAAQEALIDVSHSDIALVEFLSDHGIDFDERRDRMGVTAEDFLEHHGIKGMHWGVRKAKIQKSAKRRANRFDANKRLKSKRRDVSARRRQISEGDLKKVIERLQSEKKLKDLVDNDTRPGRTVAKKIMSESGQKVARTVIAGGGLILIKALIDKKMGVKVDDSGEKVDLVKENMKLLNEHIKNKIKKGK